MSAKILPKHTYRKQCSHDYFINSFVFFFNYSWGNSCSFQRSQWELCMILRSDGSILNAPYCSNSEHREYRNEKRLQAVSGLHQSQQGKGMLYPVLFVK